MCKILVLTKTEKIKDLNHVSEVIAEHLQRDQVDGFGYAILGDKGTFGERTISKEDFKSRIGKEKLLVDSSLIEPTYNSFGNAGKPIGGAIFHGRTSTNALGLINTHPINKNGWSLIHNGVVSNKGAAYKKETGNDTEDLVHYLSTAGITGIEENCSGYYAIGALDPQGNLHVIRDGIASLYVAINKTLGCLIFGTTSELIESIADELDWTIGPIEQARKNLHLIFSPSGALIHTAEISPLGYTQWESEKSYLSLGRKIDSTIFESDDYKAYRDEIEYQSDSSYKFFDWNGREMSREEFLTCDEVTKLDCTVFRADGTIVDPEDFYKERLA